MLELWLFCTLPTRRRGEKAWYKRNECKSEEYQWKVNILCNVIHVSISAQERRAKQIMESLPEVSWIRCWALVSAWVCLIAEMLWRAGGSSAVNLSFSSSAFAWHVWTHASHFCAIRELNCGSPISHTRKMVGLFSFAQYGNIWGTYRKPLICQLKSHCDLILKE